MLLKFERFYIPVTHSAVADSGQRENGGIFHDFCSAPGDIDERVDVRGLEWKLCVGK